MNKKALSFVMSAVQISVFGFVLAFIAVLSLYYYKLSSVNVSKEKMI